MSEGFASFDESVVSHRLIYPGKYINIVNIPVVNKNLRTILKSLLFL